MTTRAVAVKRWVEGEPVLAQHPTTGKRAVYLFDHHGTLTDTYERLGVTWRSSHGGTVSSRFVAMRVRNRLKAGGSVTTE